jgi:Ca2+-transporting ATPase
VAWELLLLALIVYVPFLQGAFGTYALTAQEWLIIVGLSFTVVPVLEAAKWFIRRRQQPAVTRTSVTSAA